jgi:hypothetical protein
MLDRLSGPVISRYIQIGYELLAIIVAAAWFGLIGFVVLQGAYELAGSFVVFTVLIGLLAYANERPE